MTPVGVRFFVGLLLALGVANIGWAKPYGSIEFEPCHLPAPAGVRSPAALCGQIQVPEDWHAPSGRQIQLALAWLPARARHPAPTPLILIAGGPGQAAREAFTPLLPAYEPIREQHHIFLIDQRGTGASAPIQCPPMTDETDAHKASEVFRSWAKNCVAQHKEKQDLSQYHTEWAVRDLDAIRRELKIDAWNMLAVSYGTRVAQRYAQRFPTRVNGLILDGVIPNDVSLGAEDDVNLEHAIEAQLERCNEAPACKSRFGDAYEALVSFAQQLDAQSIQVHVRHPRAGQMVERRLDVGVLASWVRVMAYAPELIPLMPWTLKQAQMGDAGPLVAQAWMIEEMLEKQISVGMQLSVICNEIPRPAPRVKKQGAPTRLLFQRPAYQKMRALCAYWPTSNLPLDDAVSQKVETTTLLLSGQYDPVTPPSYGERAAADFLRSRHLVLQGQSHGVSAIGCAPQLIASFLAHPTLENIDDGCLQKLEAPPFFLHAQGTSP